jgi:hypothetical protein
VAPALRSTGAGSPPLGREGSVAGWEDQVARVRTPGAGSRGREGSVAAVLPPRGREGSVAAVREELATTVCVNGGGWGEYGGTELGAFQLIVLNTGRITSGYRGKGRVSRCDAGGARERTALLAPLLAPLLLRPLLRPLLAPLLAPLLLRPLLRPLPRSLLAPLLVSGISSGLVWVM